MTGVQGPRPISEVAARLGVARQHVVPYGDDKAKIRLDAREALGRPPGRLVLVSAITPTDAGEGKTTTSIALAQGLARIGERTCLALREPSLGPVFGRKGGATGAGRARLTPAEDINLHFTGDLHAVGTAHNLLAAMLDNRLHFATPPRIDPRRVLWRRVMDLNDRVLREIVVGLGGPAQGVPRETGFDITAASEVMAILCLAEDTDDLDRRLARVIVALDVDGRPVTAAEIGAVGAMKVLLKDALLPNLVQTGEGVPALVHGGPFANLAHGCNSVLATRLAMAAADWTVTEAGFAFDLGGEKFFDLKCAGAGLAPAAVVMVSTVRALARHGGVAPRDRQGPDPAAVERGLGNLEKHLESIAAFERPAVVALNRFAGDGAEEIAVVERFCRGRGIPFAISEAFERGGDGATALAEVVRDAALADPPPVRRLYADDDPIATKLDKVARAMYGADGVVWTAEAKRDAERLAAHGGATLPICVVKTQSSLSDDASRVGRPRGFEVTVRGVLHAAGAGFAIPLLGTLLRMPGLPATPQAERIDLVGGQVIGIG